jgi:hypothetical protein
MAVENWLVGTFFCKLLEAQPYSRVAHHSLSTSVELSALRVLCRGMGSSGCTWLAACHHKPFNPAFVVDGIEFQHLSAAAIQPSWGESGGRQVLLLGIGWLSDHLWRPAPLPHHVVRPALAAAGEVLALRDQALVQLAGEQRDAVDAGVVAKPVAGHADLAAAGLEQHALVEVGPLLNWTLKLRDQGRRP